MSSVDRRTARVEHNLLAEHPEIPQNLKARDLEFSLCSKGHAVVLARLWHSRLPKVQDGPWMFAFKASCCDVTFAVALWNSPSARTLPSHWLELRRLACSPDAPRNTCSRFLGWMIRYLRKQKPSAERCISYQDMAVHEGTIYKASNWVRAFVAKGRRRDRSRPRKGTLRAYRSNINSDAVDASTKVRWEMKL